MPADFRFAFCMTDAICSAFAQVATLQWTVHHLTEYTVGVFSAVEQTMTLVKNTTVICIRFTVPSATFTDLSSFMVLYFMTDCPG